MSKTKKEKKTKKQSKAKAKAIPKKEVKALKKEDKPLSLKGKKKEAVPVAVAITTQVTTTEVKEEVVLTNAEGKRYCKVSECDEIEAIDGYCRLHYIMFWKRNKTKGKILEGGKLDKYIDELTQRYPDKYLEMLKKDLASEKDFNSIIAEMDAEDASDDAESEEDDNRFIEEVRGTVPTGAGDEDEF